MPYTYAHPGFSLWLRRYLPGLSTTGLLVGSVVPDLDILFRFREARHHLFELSALHIFLIMLPAGYLLTLYADWFLRRSATIMLPEGISRRIPPPPSSASSYFSGPNLLSQAAGLMTGIALHLLLDRVTHPNPTLYMYLADYLFAEKIWLLKAVYYGSWYLPQILATGIGFYFLYHLIWQPASWRAAVREVNAISGKALTLWRIFLNIAVLFVVLKFALFGYEGYFGLHYLIIYLTGGITAAILIMPPVEFLLKSKNVKK